MLRGGRGETKVDEGGENEDLRGRDYVKYVRLCCGATYGTQKNAALQYVAMQQVV